MYAGNLASTPFVLFITGQADMDCPNGEGAAPMLLSCSAGPSASDLTVRRLWSEHYNGYYWHYYALFNQGLEEEGIASEVSSIHFVEFCIRLHSLLFFLHVVKKNRREPGIFHHVHGDVGCMIWCVVLLIEFRISYKGGGGGGGRLRFPPPPTHAPIEF